MPVREMCQLPRDVVLRRKAKKVSSIDKSVQRLIDDMIETMHHQEGVGLAAPQIGVSLRVIVVQMPEEDPIAMINPEVVKRSGEREVNEACLSVPGYGGEIKRSVTVTVKGLDREGKSLRIKADGLLAQALEHEIDHLDGKLFIDHIEADEKLYRVVPSDEGGGM
jgi:peptide deformylase